MAGNTPATALNLGSLSGTRTFTDFVGSSDTNDFYRFSLSSSSRLSVILSGLNGGDVDLQLFNSSGALLLNRATRGTANETISSQTLPAGTYFLRVYPFSGNSNYNLSLNAVPTAPTAPVDNAGNTFATARNLGALSTTQTVSDFVGSADTNDFYRFSLATASNFSLTLNGLSGGDADLQLFDANGNLLLTREADGTANEIISNQALQAGNYFLRVYPFSGNSNYNLSLNAVTSTPTTTNPTTTNPTTTTNGFQIDLNYTGDPRFAQLFAEAAQRWAQVIVTDLPDFGGIDDLLITANVTSIDGQFGVLGSAGPTSFRSVSSGGLPLQGVMNFDSADLESLAANGQLKDVILHEMGHVLGIGTLWDSFGLRSGSSYLGSNGVREYAALTGTSSLSSVPLETQGGQGTANSHWSEAVFRDELMTGFLSGPVRPLSRLTVASLQDIGYGVNYQFADAFSIPLAATGTPQTTTQTTNTTLIRQSNSPDLLTGLSSSNGQPQVCYCETCRANGNSLNQLQRSQISSFASAIGAPDLPWTQNIDTQAKGSFQSRDGFRDLFVLDSGVDKIRNFNPLEGDRVALPASLNSYSVFSRGIILEYGQGNAVKIFGNSLEDQVASVVISPVEIA
jgi:hypothetical protein